MKTLLILLLPLAAFSQVTTTYQKVANYQAKIYTINVFNNEDKENKLADSLVHVRDTDHLVVFQDTYSHIYHSKRLKLIQENKTVTGTVEHIIQEKDGDYHIRLKLDSCQNLLNQKNIDRQHGCLVLEIICACEVTQVDAIDACRGFINNVVAPKVGQHITVTGSYVLDQEHGWNELHPVTALNINAPKNK